MGKTGFVVTCVCAGVVMTGTGWSQPTGAAGSSDAVGETVLCRGQLDHDYDIGDGGRGSLVIHFARGDAAGAHGADLAPGTCAYADGSLPDDAATLRSEESAPGASVFDALFPCLSSERCVIEVRTRAPSDPSVVWFDPREVAVRFSPPASGEVSEPPSPPAAPVIALPGQLKRVSGELGTFSVDHDGALPPTIATKICIDPAGDVSDVEVLTDVRDDLRTQLVERIGTFRYAPFDKDGVPVAACVAETFRTHQVEPQR